MELIGLRSTVRTRLGIPIADSFTPDNVIDSHINLAISTIEEDHRWPWQERVDLHTLADDTGIFTPPADWHSTRALIVDQQQVAIGSPIDLYMITGTSPSAPYLSAIIDGQINLRPAPAAGKVVTHIYYAMPTLLVDDTDEPQMPTVYSPAIISKACEMLQVRRGENTSAGAYGAEFAQWVARMRKDVTRYTGPSTPRIRPGNWV